MQRINAAAIKICSYTQIYNNCIRMCKIHTYKLAYFLCIYKHLFVCVTHLSHEKRSAALC